ncbi:MAG: hypothetical protein RLZZ127_1148 [Planctomycetota bacterium]|jgi:hypothetical protein
MPATFACPTCGATYPVKPVLVGRAVRCTACKKPFRLREDGIADLVPEAAPAPASPAPAPAVPVVPAAPASESAASAPTPPPSGQSPATERRSQRLRTVKTSVNEDLRRTMASTLSSAIGDAIKAEDRKVESERIAKAVPAKDKPVIGPAVLTGEGERAAREAMRWRLGIAAAALALAGLAWLILHRGPVEAAVAAFTAAVERGESDAAGGRVAAIQQRGWVQGIPGGLQIDPFIDLRDLVQGRETSIPAGEVLAPFAGRVRVPGPDAWVPAAQATAAAAAWADKPDAKAFLARADLQPRTDAALAEAVAPSGARAAAVVAGLLRQPPVPGRPSLAAALAAAALPARIDLLPVSGRDGWLLMPDGTGFKVRQGVPFHGVLVRIPDLDPAWRFAGLRAGEPPVE